MAEDIYTTDDDRFAITRFAGKTGTEYQITIRCDNKDENTNRFRQYTNITKEDLLQLALDIVKELYVTGK